MSKTTGTLLGWLKKYSSYAAASVLVIAAICLYQPFLHSPILFDDKNFTENFRQLPIWSLRGLPYATMWWTVDVFGNDIYWVRIGNLVLHAAVAVALYAFLHALFSRVLATANWQHRLSPQWMAFFAALIFTLHPVAVYGVAYMIQRTILMSALFSLISLILYCKGLWGGRSLPLWASVLAYLLAVFSKEHAVFLPVVMLAITVLTTENPFRKVFEFKYIYLGYFVVACTAAILRRYVVGQLYEPNAEILAQAEDIAHPYLLSVITQSTLFFKYVYLWMLPNPNWMSGDMRESFAHAVFSPYLAAFVLFLLMLGLSIRLLFMRGLLGLVGLAIFFPVAMFTTELATVRLQEPFVLYRSYLWAIGGFTGLPVICLFLSRKIAMLLLTVAALLMVPLSLDRLATFANPILFWEDAERLLEQKKIMPLGAERIYNNLGNAYAEYFFYKKALLNYEKTIRIEPNLFQPWLNMGRIYSRTGKPERSVHFYNRTLLLLSGQPKDDPYRLQAYLERGEVYAQLKQFDKAKEDFQIACQGGLEPGCRQESELSK